MSLGNHHGDCRCVICIHAAAERERMFDSLADRLLTEGKKTMKGRDPRPGEEHVRYTKSYVDVLLPAIRTVAEQCGYAIGVHGSLERDIDLIGCPWRDSAVSAECLAKRIFEVCQAVYGHCKWSGGWTEQCKPEEFPPPAGSLPNPSKMPCGRLAWIIMLNIHSNHYIDLSVMPKVSESK